MAQQRLKLTRRQLGAFLQDHESIKQFEKLFEVVDDVDQSLIADPYGALGESPTIDRDARSLIESIIIQNIERAPEQRMLSELDQWGGATVSPAIKDLVESGLWADGRQGTWVDQYNPVLSKISGRGIKVDIVNPSFPWADITGLMAEDPGGANSPVLTVLRGGLCRVYAYTVNDKVDLRFHVPHDYAPGTDMHIHVHWSHNGTAISGNFTLSCASSYAKGHNQAIFPAERTVTITYATVDIATTPQYMHRSDEVQWSSNGGSATLADSAQLEPDGVVLMNCTLTSLPTITGGTTPKVFIHYIDLHYQTTGINTKNRAPGFYN